MPNGSFEEVINCPQGLGDIANTMGWYGSIQVPGVPMNENPSPDWYHACSESDILSPPSIIYGAYQEPLDGEGYAGIITYNLTNLDYREYIGIELLEPLEINQTYNVNFNIVRSPNQANSVASNNFGTKFSLNSTFISAESITNNHSHFNIDTLLRDTTNWNQISFEFIADSAYRFIHFGNFYNDVNSQYELIGDAVQYRFAYYLIDKISLTESVVNTFPEYKEPEFNLYPNPSYLNEELSIQSVDVISKIRILNCFGSIIHYQDNILASTALITPKIYRSGIYIVQIMHENSNRWYNVKLIII